MISKLIIIKPKQYFGPRYIFLQYDLINGVNIIDKLHFINYLSLINLSITNASMSAL